MAITLFGLKNCDTCRKALKMLKAAKVPHAFVDVRADGVSHDQIARWADSAGWETLLNRRGTTWRGLDEAQKADVDAAAAIDLMAQYPALIKRPVIEAAGQVMVGFTADIQAALFK
jgi:Spx/MgsR family transcriptional regulator